MRPVLATLLVLISAASGIAQKTKSTDDLSNHFRWSEQRAHELKYENKISTSSELVPQQKTALLNDILAQLNRQKKLDPEMFEGLSTRDLHRLAVDTRIELMDLNGDGIPEVIAQANGLGPCGGTGNCIFWVFQATPHGFTLLLDSTKGRWGGYFEVVRVWPSLTNGFRDIVLGAHDSASVRTLVVHRFSNGRYRQSACYHSSWESETLQSLKSPEISVCGVD